MDIQALQLTNVHLDLIMDFIASYLIQRYIFLEQGFKDHKKQYIYYLVTLMISLAFGYFFSENIAAISIIITEGLNMSLARFERLRLKYPEIDVLRINSFIDRQYDRDKAICFIVFPMAIPIFGIASGFVTPLICTPSILLELDSKAQAWYQLSVLFVISVFIICLLTLGHNWRAKFAKEVGSKGLKGWERGLLCVTGCLTLISSFIISQPVSNFSDKYGQEAARAYGRSLAILGAISFFLTLTVVVLVITNNQKSFLNERISDMQLNIITMMADIVENRDENTGGHIRRTAKYVEIIANELKREGVYTDTLSDQYIRDMIVAAPLHDIGKIHVSDLILNKHGKLTSEEFEKMKEHAAEGRKLLIHAREQIGDFSYIDIAIDMAGSHHEWWDGSAKGYPSHASGEAIPLCARIMAVADVFDALISKRCYKDPMSLPQAFEIIDSESGTHFDPAIVTAFDSRREEIEAALSDFQLSE